MEAVIQDEVTSVDSLIPIIESELGSVFTRRDLLTLALTHSSFCNEAQRANPTVPQDNERLEFLGDAVIGLVIAQALMDRYPNATEGKLSRWRSQLVSRKTLAEIAWEVGMGDWVLLGKGERQTGGNEKRSILAGVFEAVIGALYLDAGLEKARAYLLKAFEPWILTMPGIAASNRMLDVKTFLQEKTQAQFRQAPSYRVIETWGKEHEKSFRVVVELNGDVLAEGEGRSKKEAEAHAASLALEKLGF